MSNSMRTWLGCTMGAAALMVGSVANAASASFPTAPAGTPVAGAVGLGLLAASALVIGLRKASRSK